MTRLRLEIAHRGRTISSMEPDGDVVHIGRGRSAEVEAAPSSIAIDDPAILPDHARVLLRDDRALIEDPGGAGGVGVRRGGERLEVVAGAPLALASGDVIELGTPGEPPAVEIRVQCDAEPEAPRIFEMRPIAKLQGGSVPARADPILRTICELQRAIGSASDMPEVLRAVADAALVLVERATHATLVLREEIGAAPDESPLVPVLAEYGAKAAGG